MEKLNRDDALPPDKPNLLLRRVESGESIHVVCFTSFRQGFWFHWLGKRSARCTAFQGAQCYHCENGRPQKWRCFLHVGDVNTRKQFFLELSGEPAKSLQTQTNGKSLRGCRFILSRKGGHATASVEVQGYVDEDRLGGQVELDVEPALKAIWNHPEDGFGTNESGDDWKFPPRLSFGS